MASTLPLRPHPPPLLPGLQRPPLKSSFLPTPYGVRRNPNPSFSPRFRIICAAADSGASWEREEARWPREEQRWLHEERRWLQEETAKSFAVAWVDPALIKRSPISLHHRSSDPSKLHLPLSLETLQNPSSSLTVQIVSSRLPFRAAKPVFFAAIPLSSLPASGKPFALALRRPSGRPHGSLRLSARILWYLALAPPSDPGDGPR